MLTLRSSPLSPFGRKVTAAIAVLGLEDRVQMVPANTTDASDPLRQQNPLGKIPTLVLEDGTSLFDSRVIVEYLDEIDGRHLLFPKGKERFVALREQALGDGMLDASILQVYEARFRPPEHHVQSWLDYQRGKLERGLAEAARSVRPVRAGSAPDIGAITIACTLGYLDFRFAGEWRKHYPGLVDWFAAFEKAHPWFTASTPKA